MIDAAVAIRTYYAAQTELTAVIGSRLWAEKRYSVPGYTPSQGPAIAFAVRGGRPDYMGQTLNPSVQFKIYGADEQAANAAYGVWYDVTVNGAGHGIKSSVIEVLGQTLAEPDSGWLFVLAFARFWLNAN